MAKRLSLILIIMMVFSLVLVACQKGEQKDNTVALPLISSQSDKTGDEDTYPAGEGTGTSAEDVYPSGSQTDVAQTYPIDKTSPNYDADMEAWVKELFGSQHTLDFVLSHAKTEAEWRAHFNSPAHEHLNLTEGQLDILIEWLLERTK